MFLHFGNTVLAKPVTLRDGLKTATVSMTYVEVALVTDQELRVVIILITDVTMVRKRLDPV